MFNQHRTRTQAIQEVIDIPTLGALNAVGYSTEGFGHGSGGEQKRREYCWCEAGGWLRESRGGSEAAEADDGNLAEQKKRRVSTDSPPDWHWSG